MRLESSNIDRMKVDAAVRDTAIPTGNETKEALARFVSGCVSIRFRDCKDQRILTSFAWASITGRQSSLLSYQMTPPSERC